MMAIQQEVHPAYLFGSVQHARDYVTKTARVVLLKKGWRVTARCYGGRMVEYGRTSSEAIQLVAERLYKKYPRKK